MKIKLGIGSEPKRKECPNKICYCTGACMGIPPVNKSYWIGLSDHSVKIGDKRE